MNAAAIVEMALGVLGRIAEGISQAIAAAKAGNEEEAFRILDAAVRETGDGLPQMRARLAANKAEADKALADKFDPGTP